MKWGDGVMEWVGETVYKVIFISTQTTVKVEVVLCSHSLKTYFSISSKVSGIFLPLVSGTKIVIAPDNIAMAAKMMVGMAGWISARAATVVERVPPIFDTREEDPTPAARTVVGISSPMYMYRMAKHMVVVKLPIRARTTMGQFDTKTSRGMNRVRRNMTPVIVDPTM